MRHLCEVSASPTTLTCRQRTGQGSAATNARGRILERNLKGRNHVRACGLTDLRCVGMLEEINPAPPDGRRHWDCRLQDVIASLRAFKGMVSCMASIWVLDIAMAAFTRIPAPPSRLLAILRSCTIQRKPSQQIASNIMRHEFVDNARFHA